MPVPPKKRSRSSKRERAAHFAMKTTKLVACSNCKKMVIPHHICKHCGSYNGKSAMATRADKRAAHKAKKSAKK